MKKIILTLSIITGIFNLQCKELNDEKNSIPSHLMNNTREYNIAFLKEIRNHFQNRMSKSASIIVDTLIEIQGIEHTEKLTTTEMSGYFARSNQCLYFFVYDSIVKTSLNSKQIIKFMNIADNLTNYHKCAQILYVEEININDEPVRFLKQTSIGIPKASDDDLLVMNNPNDIIIHMD